MTELKSGYQLNGVSLGWGAAALAIGFASILIAIGIQNLIMAIVGILLIGLAFGLALSKTSIHIEDQSNTLYFNYKNLFKRIKMNHTLEENDFITFKHDNTPGHQIDMLIVSTNWYPVKTSSYFVVLQTKEEDPIILDECIDLKETFQVSKMFSKKLGLEFVSPLKFRGRNK